LPSLYHRSPSRFAGQDDAASTAIAPGDLEEEEETMKGKLSVTTAVTVVAVALAAPAALAEPGPSADWFERAAAAAVRDSGATPYADAFERPDTVNREVEAAPDWFERAAAAAERNTTLVPYIDAFERPDPTSFEKATSSTDSGTDIAWSQIMIAFGVGLLLALGLMVALRFRLNRTLAH
jgi:hypothetical protein